MASFLSWRFILVIMAVVLANAAAFAVYFMFGMPSAGPGYVPPFSQWMSNLGWAVISPVYYGGVVPLGLIGVHWKVGAAFGMLLEAIVVHLGAGWLSCKLKGKALKPRNLFRFRILELLVFVAFVCLCCGVYAGWRTWTTRGPAYRDKMRTMGIYTDSDAYSDASVKAAMMYTEQYQRWLSSSDTSENPTLLTELLKMKNITRLSFDNLTSLPPEIGDLSNLRVLNLRDSDLTTLPPEIGRLTTLKKLDLVGNPITDSALEHLTPLQNLELVLLQDTKVTEEGVEKLRQALPKCKVHRVYANGG